MRGINKTKDILIEKYDGDFSKINLDDFAKKQYFETTESNFRGSHVEEAFDVFYSRHLLFSAEIGNPKIIYHEGYQ